MRMPRLRFTVRGMMIAVAIAALAMGSAVIGIRWREYRALAASYRQLAELFRDENPVGNPGKSGLTILMIQRNTDGPLKTLDRDEISRWMIHYETMARKYALAARYPWLPVAPDPPEPE